MKIFLLLIFISGLCESHVFHKTHLRTKPCITYSKSMILEDLESDEEKDPNNNELDEEDMHDNKPHRNGQGMTFQGSSRCLCRFPRGTTGYPEVVGVTTTKQSGEGPVQGPNDASPLSPEDMSKAKDLLSPLDFTVGDTLVGLNVDLGSGNIDMGSEHFASVMKNAPKVKTIGPETTILAVFNLDHKGSSIYCNWLLVNLQKEGDVTDQSNTVYSWDFSTDQLPADITQGSRFVAVAVTQDGGKFDMEEIKKKATEDKRLGFTGKELSGSTIFFDNLPKKFLRMAKPGLVTGLKNWVICADGNPGCQVAGEFNGQQTGGSTGGMDGMSSLMAGLMSLMGGSEITVSDGEDSIQGNMPFTAGASWNIGLDMGGDANDDDEDEGGSDGDDDNNESTSSSNCGTTPDECCPTTQKACGCP